MSSIFGKNFHLCFSKIKCLPTPYSPPLTLEDEEEYHNKHHHHQKLNHHHEVNYYDNDTIIRHHHHHPLMVKNFNTVYDVSLSTTTTTTDDFFSSSANSYSNDSDPNPPDFSNVFTSRRFFVSSPGHSNSILDSSSTSSSSSSPPNRNRKLVGRAVPVHKYSPDPYTDFRRSMQEMIQAREQDRKSGDNDDNDDWEYLHELLVSYLTLNPKHTHKFITRAFADLLISFMSSSVATKNPAWMGE